MTSQIARLVVNSFRPRGKARRQLATLTGREEEILDLLAKGYLSKEISSSLAISVRTLETHLHHIYEKLHVRSRAQAVAKYYAG
jgi:DNA-binding NarL/FixJ family response regulator